MFCVGQIQMIFVYISELYLEGILYTVGNFWFCEPTSINLQSWYLDIKGATEIPPHILNCHFYDAIDVRQVAMVAPSS